MTDKEYLAMAQNVANESKEKVRCGCIIIQNGEVVGRGVNSQHSDRIAINHAELKAVVDANYKQSTRTLPGAVAYCSCEPCAMCLAALSYAKVGRIVYARRMSELFPDDKQAAFDGQKFVRTLNFVPKLEHISLQ